MYGEIILRLIRNFRRDFRRKLQESVGMLKVTKRISNVHFSFATSGHARNRLTVIVFKEFHVNTLPSTIKYVILGSFSIFALLISTCKKRYINY